MTKNHLDGLPPAAQKLARGAYAALSRSALPQAERAITLMLAYAPTHPEPKRLLGMFLHRAGRAREALEPLREALALRPDNPDILIALAFAQGDTGDMHGAIESMRRAAELRPGADTLYMYGRALEQNAQLDEAVTMMRRALDIDPKHPTARLQPARDLFYTGHVDEAVTEFRRLIREGREMASAWYGLAEMKTVTFDANDLAAVEIAALPNRSSRDSNAPRCCTLSAKRSKITASVAKRSMHLQEAGRIERATVPCDNAHFAAYMDSLRAAFPQPIERRDYD